MTGAALYAASTLSEVSFIEPSDVRRLAAKYSSRGPRYTSYPTAVEFGPQVNPQSWSEVVRADGSDPSAEWSSAALYVHIPFCSSLCYFCACNRIIVRDRAMFEPYLTALEREIRAYAEILPKHTVFQALHFGGGSPGLLLAEETARLLQRLREEFAFASDAELSIELDPRTSTPERVQHYRELGFTRLSLGVQDFDSVVQRSVNRIQPVEMTASLFESARHAGFRSINADLIYGLPEQNLERFAKTIRQLLELRPERIALYGYAHVTWIKKAQKTFERLHLPDAAERLELFLHALGELEKAGYVSIGMDHFALPGDSLAKAFENGTLERTFMGYTSDRSPRLIGLGASAISTLPAAFAQNVPDTLGYIRMTETGTLPIERGVLRTAEDRLRGEIIEALFCKARLDISSLERRHGISFETKFASQLPALKSMAEDGLLSYSASHLELSRLGRLFTRNVAMLFDGYLAKHSEGSTPKYSATV
ncbi:MAG: oxygen-independent coproporphyrinogen III oxidase [Bdellovibrionota bacterium]